MSVMFSNKISGTWISANSPVVERLLSFAQLSKGWHYGQGMPASQGAIKDALDIRVHFINMGVKTFEVFPRVDGSVVISAFLERIAVDVTCYGQGRFDALVEKGNAEIFDKENIGLSVLLSKMRSFGWREMSRSGYFTPSTTLGNVRDLIVQQPRYRTTASQSLTKRARGAVVLQNAVISRYSTKNTSAEIPQYFVDFDRPNLKMQQSHKIQPNQEMFAIS